MTCENTIADVEYIKRILFCGSLPEKYVILGMNDLAALSCTEPSRDLSRIKTLSFIFRYKHPVNMKTFMRLDIKRKMTIALVFLHKFQAMISFTCFVHQ
jgi:hypothetical protein